VLFLQNESVNVAVWHCSAILYQEQKRYDEAIDSYKMAIQCRPRLTSKQLLAFVPVVLGLPLLILNEKETLRIHKYMNGTLKKSQSVSESLVC